MSKYSYLAAAISAVLLSGCNNNSPVQTNSNNLKAEGSISLGEFTVNDTGRADFSQPATLTVSWGDVNFAQETCTDEGLVCADATPTITLCTESAVAADGCTPVANDLQGNRGTFSLSNVNLAANPAFFVRAQYNFGTFDSEKRRLTSAQATKFLQTLGTPDALGDSSADPEEVGEYIAVSGDGNTMVTLAVDDGPGISTMNIFQRGDNGFAWFTSHTLDALELDLLDDSATPDADISISEDGKYILVSQAAADVCRDSIDPSCDDWFGKTYVFELNETSNSYNKVVLHESNIERYGPYDEILLPYASMISGDGKTIIIAEGEWESLHLTALQKNDANEWEQVAKNTLTPWPDITDTDERGDIWFNIIGDGYSIGEASRFTLSHDGSTLAFVLSDLMFGVITFDGEAFSPLQFTPSPFGVDGEILDDIAISGDGKTLLVSQADLDDHNDTERSHGIAVYKRSGNEKFTRVQIIEPEIYGDGIYHGENIAIDYSGTYFAASIPRISLAPEEGGAYIFGQPDYDWAFLGQRGAVAMYTLGESNQYSVTSYVMPPNSMGFEETYFARGYTSIAMSYDGKLFVGDTDMITGEDPDNTVRGGVYAF